MEKIKIKRYSKKFPAYFQKEKRIISKLGRLEIYHIGSTAIPNMSGKGEIDILIIAKTPKQREVLIKNLEILGYKKAKSQREERIFIFRRKGKIRYNLHIYIRKNKKARKQIKFRDFLKKYPDEAKRYENLKKDILKKVKGNRIRYRKLKEDYFSKIFHKMR